VTTADAATMIKARRRKERDVDTVVSDDGDDGDDVVVDVDDDDDDDDERVESEMALGRDDSRRGCPGAIEESKWHDEETRMAEK